MSATKRSYNLYLRLDFCCSCRYGDWRDAISAFLFCWPDGNTKARALKMPKTGGSGMAIIDEEGKGPQFGPEGCARPCALPPRGRFRRPLSRARPAHAPSLTVFVWWPGPRRFSVNIDQRTAKSRLGTYYERRPDGARPAAGTSAMESCATARERSAEGRSSGGLRTTQGSGRSSRRRRRRRRAGRSSRCCARTSASGRPRRRAVPLPYLVLKSATARR